MGQVTIYLNDELEAQMRTAAQAAQLSKSKWIANLIRQNLAHEWPIMVHDLAGAWPDFPSLAEIRSAQSSDGVREPL
jgi:hypothetical protein